MLYRNLTLGLCALLGSCSLVLDPDKKQCQSDDQCGVFHDKPTYQCLQSYCEQVTCNDDATCRARGDFICESNACAEAQCAEDKDCKDGEMCAQGRCGDPVFGCFDQMQSLTSSQPGSLQFKLLAYGEPKPVKNLSVRVCKAADLACNSPVSTENTYDDQGTLTINGLENGIRYNIRMTGDDSLGNPFIEAEYYMQRPIVGATIEADKLEMLPEQMVALLALSAGLEWDQTKGLVLAQTFGCDNKPLAGVSMVDNQMASPFYLAGGLPNPDANETDSAGVAGFLNMEARNNGTALQHKLTFSYKGDPMFSFTVAPRPKVLTFVQVYMGDFGTTLDRAANRPVKKD
jgi:hypothetical protein